MKQKPQDTWQTACEIALVAVLILFTLNNLKC